MERYPVNAPRRAAGWVAVSLAALSLVGCGTTVQLNGSTPGPSSVAGSNDGLSFDPTPSPIEASAAPLGDGSPAATTGPAGSNVTPSGPQTQPTAAGSSAGSDATSPVGGVTAKTINIGIITADGFDKAASDLGFSVAVGNTHNEALAVVKYINAHGGLAGRRINPVFYDVNVGRSSTDHPAEEQAACTALTQDHHLFAIATAVGWSDTLFYECVRRAGVITSSAGEALDQQFFASDADYFYMPVEINMTRVMADNVDALSGAGFFKTWNPVTGNPGPLPLKIGVIRSDTPSDLRELNQGIKPALARHGLKVADTVALSPSPSQLAGQSASAVLRFKAEGITHVLVTYASPLLFMETAQTQGYFPRYGLHSRSSPAALLEVSAPKQQLRGSMGLGWQQYNDVNAAHDPGPPSSRAKLCAQILRKAGQSSSARATTLVGLWYCDTLFFLRDALAAAPNLTPAGFRQGAESLRSFEAASTFESGFAPGRLHDGARVYRMFAFQDSCKCFTYVSGRRTAP